jgi:hypothetical protein
MMYEEYIDAALRSNHERRVCGLDVHKETTYATVLDPSGQILIQRKLQNEDMPAFLDITHPDKLAMEASTYIILTASSTRDWIMFAAASFIKGPTLVEGSLGSPSTQPFVSRSTSLLNSSATMSASGPEPI